MTHDTTYLRFFAWLCLVGVVTAHVDTASAQSYPAKPVRVVTAAAGAGGDFVSRIVAAGLTELWGQPVVVDNRGGSAVIPIEVVAKAPPDGYTLLGFGTALWHLPLMQSVSYDPIRDFAPITLVATTPMILVVHPSLPVKSVKELVALARKTTGTAQLFLGHFGLHDASAGGNVQVHGRASTSFALPTREERPRSPRCSAEKRR